MQTVSRQALPGSKAVEGDPVVPLNLPPSVTLWLANLSLLYGVPFEYLVADSHLQPTESIRFFYLDPNWLRRAIDGVLSTGATSTKENVFNQAFYQQVYDAVQAAIPQVRQTVRGAPQPDSFVVGATTSGFLFRSAVVSGYPGLEVVPTLQGAPVPILRMDRLLSNVLLVLFNGVPDHIVIRQPAEGLHFGITRKALTDSTFILFLRWLGHTAQSSDVAGTQIKPTPTTTLQVPNAPLRTGSGQPPGVIDVGGTTAAVIATMGANYLGADQTFTSAEFAVEMVLSAGLQPFDVTVTPPLPSR